MTEAKRILTRKAAKRLVFEDNFGISQAKAIAKAYNAYACDYPDSPPFFMLSISPFLRAHGRVLGSFAAMQAMQLALPLLALPWLGRVLGPEAFGLLMYMCLLPPLVALFIDWGLAFGGSRAAALSRGRNQDLAALLGAALAAKFILFIACLVLCALALPFLPYAAEYPGAYFLAILAGVARGASPAWFFQGAGFGMLHMARLDVAASLLALGLVFIFIRSPEDWPLYLFFLAACKGCAYIWLTAGLCRKFRPDFGIRAGLALIKKTGVFFGSGFALMLAYNGGQLVLGYFLDAGEMGLIVAANKMLRSLVSLVNPFTQTLFPELCIWAKKSPEAARRALRISLACTGAISALCAGLVCLTAPWLIWIALGSQYAGGGKILAIAILAAPFMACNNVLANQALAPAGKEKVQLKIQAAGALLSFPLAAFLGAFWGIDGGACLPVCLEAAMFAAFMVFLLKSGSRILV